MKSLTEKIMPFGLRLPPELKEWVSKQAKKDRRSVNTWITLLIEREKDAQDERQA